MTLLPRFVLVFVCSVYFVVKILPGLCVLASPRPPGDPTIGPQPSSGGTPFAPIFMSVWAGDTAWWQGIGRLFCPYIQLAAFVL